MKLLSPKIFINGNKTLVNIVIDWLQSLLFFLCVCTFMKRKKILSVKHFLSGPTVSFCLEGEIILSEKGSSKSQVRIIHPSWGQAIKMTENCLLYSVSPFFFLLPL